MLAIFGARPALLTSAKCPPSCNSQKCPPLRHHRSTDITAFANAAVQRLEHRKSRRHFRAAADRVFKAFDPPAPVHRRLSQNSMSVESHT
jgi:hypothetical protein